MKLRLKLSGMQMLVEHDSWDGRQAFDMRRLLTDRQIERISRDPELIRQLAHFIAHGLEQQGIHDSAVFANVWVSLNGRKPQQMIAPDVPLNGQAWTFQTPSWIVPLYEPLRKKAWDIPLQEWPKHLPINGTPPQANSPDTGA